MFIIIPLSSPTRLIFLRIFVHTFCHHLPSVNAVNETSMKWSAEELHWPVLLWRYFSFFDQRELHLISFTLKTGTKILPPIPAIEGSVKQDLSLFVQIIFYIFSDYISYLFRLYFIFVPIMFYICSDYILYLFRLYFIFVPISSSGHACSMNIIHFDDIIIYNI